MSDDRAEQAPTDEQRLAAMYRLIAHYALGAPDSYLGRLYRDGVAWLDEVPMPQGLRTLAQAAGGADEVAVMEERWDSVRRVAPGGLRREDLPLLEQQCEAEYEQRRLGHRPPADMSIDEWIRLMDTWHRRWLDAAELLAERPLLPESMLDALLDESYSDPEAPTEPSEAPPS